MSTDARGAGRSGWEQATAWAGPNLLRLSELLDAWSERYRQRRALLALGDHMLKDIGIGRAEAYREGRKPFWRG